MVAVAAGVATQDLGSALILAALYVASVVTAGVRRALDLRRHRRLDSDLCVACAYDLRGSRDSGACPECGTATPWARRAVGPV